jgi:hypothetical protein
MQRAFSGLLHNAAEAAPEQSPSRRGAMRIS